MTDSPRSLDPRVLNKIARLELRARDIVEGFVSGMHRSPYHGFSVEFATHREYVPGDDLRHLDWKVFGRSDRLYLKQYELETNLRSWIVLDTSESMGYRSGEQSKAQYAAILAASLAYLLVKQQDAVGLVLFDTQVRKIIPPSSNPAHFRGIVSELETVNPAQKTQTGRVFHDVAERLHKRGLLIVVSDLFDKPEEILSGFQHFRHRHYDVIVLHVMDEFEVNFPFERMTLFEGLEQLPELLIEPKALRKAYLEEVETFTSKIQRGCLQQKIDYVRATTDQPPEVVLSRFLAARMGTTKH